MSLGAAKKLKDHPQLKLDVLDGGESLMKLATDPYTTANVLYLLCEAQCEKAGVTDEQFGEALAGDVIDEAAQALMDELVDFFPKRQREALRTMLARISAVQDQGAELGTAKLKGALTDEMIRREMDNASREIDLLLAGNSSGNAPGSLVGTGAA
jgi:hypothetical protein